MKCSILDKDLFETEMCEKQNKTYFKLVSRLGDSVVYFDQLLVAQYPIAGKNTQQHSNVVTPTKA